MKQWREKKHLLSSACGSTLLLVTLIWLFKELGLPAQDSPLRPRNWYQSNCEEPGKVEEIVASESDGLSGGHEDDAVEERATSESEVWKEGCKDKEAREDEDMEAKEKEDTDASSCLNDSFKCYALWRGRTMRT